MEIIVDDRERRSGFVSILQSILPDITVERLLLGDIEIRLDGKKFLIERKTYSDFITSWVRDGRLDKQIADLLEYDCFPILIVEKSEVVYQDYSFVKKMFQHLKTLNFSLPVIHTLSMEDTVANITEIVQKIERNEIGQFQRKVKVRGSKDEIISILTSIRGISLQKAEIIIQNFDNFDDFIHNLDKLNDVSGFGKGTVKKFKEIFEKRWSQC